MKPFTAAKFYESRNKLGLTQKALAAALGIPRTMTISDWENKRLPISLMLTLAMHYLLQKHENNR